LIAFLTDVGLNDQYAASMNGVVLSLCPNASITVISHEVPCFDVRFASLLLLTSYKYFPLGTIFVVVVVLGVGRSIRPILIVSRNYYFIDPDNGVLVQAAEDDGIENVYLLNKSRSKYFREDSSQTFHGRDIYAPIAALIACGMPVQSLGKLINYRELKRIDKDIDYVVEGDCIELRVIYIDRYGNIILLKGFKNIINELNVCIGDTIKIKSKVKKIEAVIEVSF